NLLGLGGRHARELQAYFGQGRNVEIGRCVHGWAWHLDEHHAIAWLAAHAWTGPPAHGVTLKCLDFRHATPQAGRAASRATCSRWTPVGNCRLGRNVDRDLGAVN